MKNTISYNISKKELIFLDDFLGQHYLNIKETIPNEIKSLISFIEKTPSKKIILNSRVSILNEARKNYSIFDKTMNSHETNKYLINLDLMSTLEKARILFNHLCYLDIPVEYIERIKENNNYLKIIKHVNYNPRIIEHVTSSNVIKNIENGKYIENIFESLNNPMYVWDDEFTKRLDEADRIFMFTLYSLTDNTIPIETLKKHTLSKFTVVKQIWETIVLMMF